jgi:hypothetical protein
MMNDEPEKIWNEVEVLIQHLTGQAEANHEKP